MQSLTLPRLYQDLFFLLISSSPVSYHCIFSFHLSLYLNSSTFSPFLFLVFSPSCFYRISSSLSLASLSFYSRCPYDQKYFSVTSTQIKILLRSSPSDYVREVEYARCLRRGTFSAHAARLRSSNRMRVRVRRRNLDGSTSL